MSGTSPLVVLPKEIDLALSSHESFHFYPGKTKSFSQVNTTRFHHDSTASAIIVPIIEGKKVMGCLGMESAEIDKTWSEKDLDLIRRSAEFFAATMARIRAEQARQKTEEKYRILIDNAPLGIFTVNENGYMTQFNPQMKKIILQLGFDLSRPINILTEKTLLEKALVEDIKNCLKGKDIPMTTRVYTMPKGQIVYFRTHMTALGKQEDNITGVQIIAEEITPLFHAEQRVKESERFLSDIMASLKTGVVIIDPDDCRIIDVNPYAANLIGLNAKDITGKTCHGFICPELEGECPIIDKKQKINNSERFLLTHEGKKLPILKSVSRIQRRGKDLLLECFTDIRDLKRLLDEQQLDIRTSKNILSAINGPFPRYTPLTKNLNLFSTAFYQPCQAEGGDHFFIRTLTMDNGEHSQKTIVSLKDQSGHQVGCILRSISTDLLHQALLSNSRFIDMGKTVKQLNDQLSQGGLIDPDNFCTAAVLCLDHESLLLQYTLCAHPRFLLIRNGKAMDIPALYDRRGMNMPLGFAPGLSFIPGEIFLQKKDKLVIFTDGLMEITIGNNGFESATRAFKPLELLALAQEKKGLNLSEPVEQIVAKMLAAASEISEKFIHGENKKQYPDDITVIGLEIEDQKQEIVEQWHPGDVKNLQYKIDRFLDLRLKEWKDKGFSCSMRLRVCVEEAVLNAWNHGNKKHPDKAICIKYRWGNDFHISIEDKGNGFDLSKTPDPCDPRSVISESGRGIFMIKRSACEVCYNKKGNGLYMRFSPQNISWDISKVQTKNRQLPRLWNS